ncbi:MAG: RNA methyltransferase, partial [SAR324 cluster bacterium]|nr:RNA methyltransferase [SAR324 cluster bacterium]
WESLNSEKRDSLDTLVVLDQIEDPQNLGAIIRSCGFFKMKALVLPKDHSCSISPVVSKASAGVAEWFPVIRETNINRMLEKKKKEGYWVLGLDAQADDEIDSLKVDRPFVLVLGNEGQGLRPLVQKNCDLMYRIGGNSDVDSINVSNAAAIALHKFYTSSTNLGLVPELQSSKT